MSRTFSIFRIYSTEISVSDKAPAGKRRHIRLHNLRAFSKGTVFKSVGRVKGDLKRLKNPSLVISGSWTPSSSLVLMRGRRDLLLEPGQLGRDGE